MNELREGRKREKKVKHKKIQYSISLRKPPTFPWPEGPFRSVFLVSLTSLSLCPLLRMLESSAFWIFFKNVNKHSHLRVSYHPWPLLRIPFHIQTSFSFLLRSYFLAEASLAISPKIIGFSSFTCSCPSISPQLIFLCHIYFIYPPPECNAHEGQVSSAARSLKSI